MNTAASSGGNARTPADARSAWAGGGVAYHELQQRYDRLVEQAPDAILIHMDGRITLVNAAAMRLAGARQREEIVGRQITDFLTPPFLKSASEVIEGLRSAKIIPCAVADRFRRLDGSEVDVEVTALPFLDAGRPSAHLVVRDITERVEAAAAALLAASHLRLLLARLPAMIWTTDRDLQITSTLGREQEALGRFVRSDGILLAAQRAALHGRSTSADFACNARWIEVHVEPVMGADGTVTGCLGLALDATERRRSDEHQRDAQRADAAGALAGGVAHEVASMMSVVLEFSELVLDDPSLSESQRAAVLEIERAALRADSVTGRLLAYSRRAFYRPSAFSLDSIVRDLKTDLARLLAENQQLEISLDCPPRVRADKGQIREAIVNLVLNARDSMPAGGTLSIFTSQLVVDRDSTSQNGSPLPDGHYGVITVRDTGSGMNDGTLTRIFDPFFTTKARGKGAGLGLAAVNGIMAQNGGITRVMSAPGVGSTFTLLLPLIAGGLDLESPEGRRLLLLEPKGPATIFVVDDSAASRTLTAGRLARQGYRVFEASSGIEAIELATRQGPPDLLLAELSMKEMSGAFLSGSFGARWPGLPVIFMSSDSEALTAGARAQFDEVKLLHKPFTQEVLLREIEATLATKLRGRKP